MQRYPDLRAGLLAVGIAAPLFLFLLIATQFLEHPTPFDRALMLVFRTDDDPRSPIGPPWLQQAARDVTALGSVTVLGGLALSVTGFLLIRGDRPAALVVVAAVFGAMALNTMIKAGFARPRPDVALSITQVFTASFPSGHAAVSSSTYLTLAILASRSGVLRTMRSYFIGLALALILLIGMSRIYLGVHYPTDIVGGWCIGSSWAVGCWAFMGWLQRNASSRA